MFYDKYSHHYGKQSGRLVVLHPVLPLKKGSRLFWYAECACGVVTQVYGSYLNIGVAPKSCKQCWTRKWKPGPRTTKP